MTDNFGKRRHDARVRYRYRIISTHISRLDVTVNDLALDNVAQASSLVQNLRGRPNDDYQEGCHHRQDDAHQRNFSRF